MKISDFVKHLQQVECKYGDKDIELECPNGLLVNPVLKFNKVDKVNFLDNSSKNIKSIIITWQG